ncbi:hypothetical protein SDJN02_15443, partial [Cucurbita argyrosperma subsp. argyrosperma]
MPINTESTPPPLIGKIGPYTVFMTPPSTPSTASPPQPVFESPKKVIQPPPVQPPPQQFDKSVSVDTAANGNASVAGFFRNAVSKVQNGKWGHESEGTVEQSPERVTGAKHEKLLKSLGDSYQNTNL